MLRSLHPRRRRGYVLLLVLMLTSLLSIGVATLMYKMTQSAKTSGEMIRRQKVFYKTDGMVKSAVKLCDVFFRQDPTGDDTALSTWFNTNNPDYGNQPPLALITPTGYDLDAFTVSANGGTSEAGELPNGPFQGMFAKQIPISVTVQLRDRVTKVSSKQTSTVISGQVSAFQFFGFVDGYAYLVNGPGGKFAGRIHTNGNACAGASGNLYLETLTSAGDFGLQGRSGICRGEHRGLTSWRNLYMPDDELPNGFNTYSATGWSSLFTRVTFDSSSGTWEADATATFGDQLQDAAHDVPVIRPPITGEPLAQRGRNSAHVATDNTENSRFLVDPVLDNEPADVRSQKVAYQSDIRILNGVWFLANELDRSALGTPIWSDRPGRTVSNADETWTSSTQDVGQQNLFGTSTRPNRYSYYRTDGSNVLVGNPFSASTTMASNRPVVSYGPVLRRLDSSSNPYWVPGFYNTSPESSCNPPQPNSSGSESKCWIVREADSPAELLQGTRSGFRDPWMETALTNSADDCGASRWSTLSGITPQNAYQNALFNMLPLNFDVAAFQLALADGSTGELGSYFPSGGREFNGIVWIGSTWPGSDDGYATDFSSSDHATYWPYQGNQNDQLTDTNGQPGDGLTAGTQSYAARYNGYTALSPRRSNSHRFSAADMQSRPPFQRALPLPLCSTDTNVIGDALAQYNHDASDGSFDTYTSSSNSRAFVVPDCAHYFADSGTQLKATINAVRIINGKTLSDTVLPNGLSVVTNLPMFVTGDLNSSSTPAEEPGDYRAGWVPLMIGGDTISILSNAWEDDEAPWNVPVSAYWGMRDAADTNYHGAFMFGWTESSSSGCRDEFTYSLRLQEHWNRNGSHARTIRGSLFIGFNAVFGTGFAEHHHLYDGGSWHDGGSNKYYAYDYHFDAIDNQPPGAPTYTVNAVRHWRRD